MANTVETTSTSNFAFPTLEQSGKFIWGKALNAAFGAGYGFLVTKFLTIGGIVVASPAAGAVFGAASQCGPGLFTGKTESVVTIVAKFALQFFVNLVCGLVGAYLFGYQFTFANAAILAGAMSGGVILVAGTIAFVAVNASQANQT